MNTIVILVNALILLIFVLLIGLTIVVQQNRRLRKEQRKLPNSKE